jgi:Trypsin
LIANEPGSTEHSVHEIILHPDWNSESVDFDTDVSILVLRDPVEFTANVQPICLPQQSDDEVVGTGTVVGWGLSEHSEAAGEHYDSTPNELESPVVNDSHCFSTDTDTLVTITSPRTFCDSSTKRFNLQGIVSAALDDPNRNRDRGCDVNVLSLYTNVAKFIDWIRSEMDKSKEIEWIEVEFECEPDDYR